jgi:phosphoribosylformylglycinamidine synthase
MNNREVLYKVRIEVWLRENLVDTEGKMTEEALNDLGYKVHSTRVGKVYEFIIKAKENEIEQLINEICTKLLANPIKDKYFYEVKRVNA